MIYFPIILGVINCILIFFSGWLVLWFGPKVRYFYLTIGSFLAGFSNGSLWYWTILVLSILISFWIYNKAKKRAEEGKALTYVVESVQVCTSAYFTGLMIGLIISLVWYLSS